VTAQGIIEEWLTTGSLPSKDDIITNLEPDYEPISDLGFVYECRPIEKGHDSFLKSQLEAPTAPLENSSKERAARYKQIVREQKIRELIVSRRETIQALMDRIATYLDKNQVQTEDPIGSLDSIRECLTMLDKVVLEANRLNSRGEIRVERLLTKKQLEQLAAAATYHYIPELAQEQVVGEPESIFPTLTRPTLTSWLGYVKLYDQL